MADAPHRPDIHIAPPLIFMGGFLAGFLIHGVAALTIAANSRAVPIVGVVLMALGALLGFWGVIVFHRAHTSVLPFRPSTALVRSGPYRFTRNPMYLGMTLAYTGLALVFNTMWPLILLPLVLVAMVKLVIVREEEYLEAVFGDEYRALKRDVRRWV